jgi:uncharacterized protein (DUF2252 family)
MTEFTAAKPLADMLAEGRALRERVPRSAHGVAVAADRDPIGILREQNSTRIPELVPLRMQRMLESPFAFFRGSAAIMAADLAVGASTGVHVVTCGDAHVSNFGLYAGPSRALVFDLNDFDEAAWAPWEWDVKRLAASVVIGARDRGWDLPWAENAAREAVATYRTALRRLSERTPLERYFVRGVPDASGAFDERIAELTRRAADKALRRTGDQAAARMTEIGADGTRRFVDDPPVLEHVGNEHRADLDELVQRYRSTASIDIDMLMSSYRHVDTARRVVGVGSVGTACHVSLFLGPRDEPLILQIKQALDSALVAYGGAQQPPGVADSPNGRRVVDCQRILQAASDPFLGWFEVDGREYYIRQFRDMKGGVDLQTVKRPEFAGYARACATMLARAHSQSPQSPVAAGYLGRSSMFETAVAQWAVGYAAVVEADFQAAREAFVDELNA